MAKKISLSLTDQQACVVRMVLCLTAEEVDCDNHPTAFDRRNAQVARRVIGMIDAARSPQNDNCALCGKPVDPRTAERAPPGVTVCSPCATS